MSFAKFLNQEKLNESGGFNINNILDDITVAIGHIVKESSYSKKAVELLCRICVENSEKYVENYYREYKTYNELCTNIINMEYEEIFKLFKEIDPCISYLAFMVDCKKTDFVKISSSEYDKIANYIISDMHSEMLMRD